MVGGGSSQLVAAVSHVTPLVSHASDLALNSTFEIILHPRGSSGAE